MRDGAAVWTMRDIEDARLTDIQELKSDGRSVRQIAQELNISKSAVQRALSKAGTEDASPTSRQTLSHCPALQGLGQRDS